MFFAKEMTKNAKEALSLGRSPFLKRLPRPKKWVYKAEILTESSLNIAVLWIKKRHFLTLWKSLKKQEKSWCQRKLCHFLSLFSGDQFENGFASFFRKKSPFFYCLKWKNNDAKCVWEKKEDDSSSHFSLRKHYSRSKNESMVGSKHPFPSA